MDTFTAIVFTATISVVILVAFAIKIGIDGLDGFFKMQSRPRDE